MSKVRSIVTLGICIVLFATLLFSNIILAQDGGSYDPWMDLNDDGIINPEDLQLLALIYSTSGTPINKTERLLILETRVDNLNTSLLADYYNKTDCDNLFALIVHNHDGRYYTESESDSLFALLSHMHSASDISGGSLKVDQIMLGNTEGDQYIFFYDSEDPFGEYILWHDALDRFAMSDDVYIGGNIEIEGTLNASIITIPTTTRYYSIPSPAWLPYSYTYTFFRGVYTYTTTSGSTGWYAPVNLPHGAVVTELRAWLYDASTTYNIEVNLMRQSITVVSQMARIRTSGSSPSFVEYANSSIGVPTVDNRNYAYYVHAYMRSGDNTHRLNKVRITYTIDETLP